MHGGVSFLMGVSPSEDLSKDEEINLRRRHDLDRIIGEGPCDHPDPLYVTRKTSVSWMDEDKSLIVSLIRIGVRPDENGVRIDPRVDPKPRNLVHPRHSVPQFHTS